MKTIKNIIINTIICALLIGACGLAAFAQQKENTFEITITNKKQIEEFVAKNQKFLQIEERAWTDRVLADKTNVIVDGEYRREFLRANGIAEDVVCSSGYINYSGDFFPLNEITKIKVTKSYRMNGYRKLKKKVLFLDIELSGNGNKRKTSIHKNLIGSFGGKKIKCHKKGAETAVATPEGFTYPKELYIPSAALAQNQLQQSLGGSNAKEQLALNQNDSPAIQLLKNQAALI